MVTSPLLWFRRHRKHGISRCAGTARRFWLLHSGSRSLVPHDGHTAMITKYCLRKPDRKTYEQKKKIDRIRSYRLEPGPLTLCYTPQLLTESEYRMLSDLSWFLRALFLLRPSADVRKRSLLMHYRRCTAESFPTTSGAPSPADVFIPAGFSRSLLPDGTFCSSQWLWLTSPFPGERSTYHSSLSGQTLVSLARLMLWNFQTVTSHIAMQQYFLPVLCVASSRIGRKRMSIPSVIDVRIRLPFPDILTRLCTNLFVLLRPPRDKYINSPGTIDRQIRSPRRGEYFDRNALPAVNITTFDTSVSLTSKTG
jgi:hypothetical protein